jgi:hypothetical protein
MALGLMGCTRAFFRQAADKEVEQVLTEKNQNPTWAIEKWWVYPDPRTRFADPTNPDRPPMPPDDPEVAKLAPNPQKPHKAGVDFTEGTGYLALMEKWDKENRAFARKNYGTEVDATEATSVPSGPRPLDFGPNTPHRYRINLEQAAELGLINSREYQDQRENLYLAALPVTQERFSFSAQFFLAEQAIRDSAGEHVPGGRRNNWTSNTGIGFGKLFETGGLLLFNLANQTIFNLGGLGSKETVSTSTLSLNLIQPFLRGGGRAVTLEPLTQAERNLVYQVRVYARFRKEFYASIAGAGGGSITGGSFVPTGVVGRGVSVGAFGTSGIVPGIIPGVPVTGLSGLQVPGSPAGAMNLSTAIPPSITGYLGTLLQYVQIGLDRANIANLDKFLKIFRAIKEGGDILQVQVDTVEQQRLRGYNSYFLDQNQYSNALDNLKLQLGVPTDLPLEVDDTPVRPLLTQFSRFQEVLDQYAVAVRAANLLSSAETSKLRAELRKLAASTAIVQGTRFKDEFPKRWQAAEKLTAKELKDRLDPKGKDKTERDKLLNLHTELELEGKALSAKDQQRLDQLNREIDLNDFEQTLRDYETEPWKREPNPVRQRTIQTNLFHGVTTAYLLVFIEARNERIEKLRNSWPALPAVCVENKDLIKADLDEATRIVDRTTIANRLDLMNVRAQTVDAWRQLAVYANALLGVLNVQYQLSSTTPPLQAKPLAFTGSRTQSQLILNAELPLVRILQRNNYRASLVAFQRQRRALMEAEDLAKQVVQAEIKQLRQFAEQYKLYQRQVELAYLTVDSSLEIFQQPPPPGTATDTATRGASLAQQLLNAQAALPVAQNALLTAYITYLNTRLQLYRDLELMPLDNRGVWIDEYATCDQDGPASAGAKTGRKSTSGPEKCTAAGGNSPRRLPEGVVAPAAQRALVGPN